MGGAVVDLGDVAAVRVTSAAWMFSLTRSGRRLPAMGTMVGAFASSQARATWLG
jgi:hypothetical protein